MKPAATVVSLLLMALAVPLGCGGDDSPTASGTRRAADEPATPATRILARAVAALGRVDSFHIRGVEYTREGRSTFVGDVSLPGRARIRSVEGRKVAQLVLVGGDAYFRGNAAFWADEGKAEIGRRLAGRWVRMPASAPGVTEFAALANRSLLGYCLLETHVGTLRVVGRRTFQGRPVTVIADRGDRPGTAPGELYLAAGGAPLPVRLVLKGAQKPGGVPSSRCGETDSSSKVIRGDLRLSRYDRRVAIEAPRGALDLSSQGSGASA